MNSYITGAFIKKLRTEKNMTQEQLASKLYISAKAVSKWETGKGYPDVSLLEDLSNALGVSVIELISGSDITNVNRSFNMKRMSFYVCPVCGNIIFSAGQAVISCCGITLPPLEAEKADEEHEISIEVCEDEYYVSSQHPMTKDHYLSFFAAVRDNACTIVKLYPEGNAEARFKIAKTSEVYYYCNKHGLFRLHARKKH